MRDLLTTGFAGHVLVSNATLFDQNYWLDWFQAFSSDERTCATDEHDLSQSRYE